MLRHEKRQEKIFLLCNNKAIFCASFWKRNILKIPVAIQACILRSVQSKHHDTNTNTIHVESLMCYCQEI